MRAFVRKLALTALSFLLVSPAFAADSKPDVLFVAVDDLNVWVSCLQGHPQIKTPNIDRLAQRGMTFTHAYCAAPACNPSRAALLSGKKPTTTGIYHNDQPWKPVLKDTLTLPEHLKNNGYRVVGGGKIFHGASDPKHWDDYWNKPGDPAPKMKSLNGLNMQHFDWGPLDCKDEDMGDYKLVTWAGEQLQAKREKPLFLAVGFVKPHLPWYVPKKYFDLFPLESIQLPKTKGDDLDDIPQAGIKVAKPNGDHKAVVDARQWEKGVQAYLATISFVDAQVGRLLDALDKSPRKDQTIIVFWGDHGWHLGEKQHWRKFALWEEATHAPLFICAPGVTRAKSTCATPIDFNSLYATVTELCGLETPGHVEGKSLKPLLADPKAKWEEPAITTHGKGNHGIRWESWRYIRYADGSEELYDHSKDPHEWTNLAKKEEHAAIKKKLAGWLPAKEAADAPKMKGADGD